MATLKEVADHLGISPRRVRQLCDEGTLPKPPAKGALDIDTCRMAMLKHLREAAAGRASTSGADLAGERARLAVSQRERVDLDIAITRNEYVLISEAVRQLGLVVEIVVENFRTVGAYTAPRLAAAIDLPPGREAALTARMQDIVQAGADHALEAFQKLNDSGEIIKLLLPPTPATNGTAQ
jgi:terminase small subunit / prophage DNA-packing protein